MSDQLYGNLPAEIPRNDPSSFTADLRSNYWMQWGSNSEGIANSRHLIASPSAPCLVDVEKVREEEARGTCSDGEIRDRKHLGREREGRGSHIVCSGALFGGATPCFSLVYGVTWAKRASNLPSQRDTTSFISLPRDKGACKPLYRVLLPLLLSSPPPLHRFILSPILFLSFSLSRSLNCLTANRKVIR